MQRRLTRRVYEDGAKLFYHWPETGQARYGTLKWLDLSFSVKIIGHRRCVAAGLAVSLLIIATAASAQVPVKAFRSECARKAQAASHAGKMAVVGKNGWLFFGPELRFLSAGPFWGANAAKVSKATDLRYADPLPAILDFKRQLDKAKIELILVPVPPKAVVYPDFLTNALRFKDAPPRLDPDLRAFYALLRKSGVNVLDLTPEFLANRAGEHGAVFCKQDTHWSGKACVLAAGRIAALVRTRSWVKPVPKRRYAAHWETVPVSGDLRDEGDTKTPLEPLPLRIIGGQSPVETSRASPVLLLGDSHTLVFHAGGDMLATGAGLADQLAFELGFPVDLIGVRGSGATPARITLLRQARSDPRYLASKKLVIWCVAAREFTESSGWRNVPIVK